MGIFSRKQRVNEGPAGTTTAPTTTTTKTSRKSHGHKAPTYYSMATKPSFGQWLKYTWLDIVTMAALGIIGLGVCDISPSIPRYLHRYYQLPMFAPC